MTFWPLLAPGLGRYWLDVTSDQSEPEHGQEPDDGELPGEIRVHHPRRALPTDVVRPTRAEVRLSALRYNLGQLRKVTGRTPIWGVLKADAYGLGSKAVARTLERAKMDGVCVALVEEGIELRQAGIQLPILVMGGYYGDALRELLEFRLTPVLSDVGQVEALARAVRYGQERPFGCHVKVDTGMARLGTRHEGWPRLIEALAERPELSVLGLMSHLANADVGHKDALEEPLALFDQAHAQFVQGGVVPVARHLANSAALLRDARTHFDLVRPGLALFGVDPCPPLVDRAGGAGEVRFRPAMSVLSRVVTLRQLQKGDGVGYGATYVAQGKTWVATVPMGYADGLSRALSNRGHALIRGKRVPIVGNISMDMTMVDVSGVPGVAVGDEVVLLGSQAGPLGQDTITAEEVARHAGTIPWEVLTNISRRVPRFYRED